MKENTLTEDVFLASRLRIWWHLEDWIQKLKNGRTIKIDKVKIEGKMRDCSL
jgi:hypothetical protein